MLSIKIKIEGWQAIVGKFGKIPDAITAGLRDSGGFLIGELRNYPAPSDLSLAEVYGKTLRLIEPKGRKPYYAMTPFVSSSQHLWFFANIGRSIGVPRSRSYNFADSWFVDGVTPATVTVKNSSSYGHFLMGNGEQSKYHKRTWDTIEEVADRNADHVAEIIGYKVSLAFT